jgi:6-pyruvoyltetrahydropterin/6-carboxytetrahydropterin synthase
MMVELEGRPDERGFLIDFKTIKDLLNPLVDAWDHAILVADSDHQLLQITQQTGWKHFILPYDTTSENLCRFAAWYLGTEGWSNLKKRNIDLIRVRIQETETCYAELELPVPATPDTWVSALVPYLTEQSGAY